MSKSDSSVKGWIAGILATVVSGVAIYYLTEGRKSNPEPEPITPTSPSTSPSQPNLMGLLCILNTTNQTILFQYRWGNSSWLNGRVDVNNWAVLRWDYAVPNQNTSPNLEIAFDANMTQLEEYQYYTISPQDIISVPIADCNPIANEAYSFAVGNDGFLSLQSP